MTQHYHYRIVQLLKMLNAADKPLTGWEICDQLAIKPRTLRSDLVAYKAILLEKGVRIDARPGAGYKLQILDQDKFQQLIIDITRKAQQQHATAPLYYADRVNYIIRALLASKAYIKLDELAEAIYISRSTLNSCMKDVRKAFAAFGLQLRAKMACGVRIQGSELAIRQATAKYFFYNSNQNLQQENTRLKTRQKISAILAAVLEEGQITLTEIGFQNLVVHLEIALMRIDHPQEDTSLPERYRTLEQRDEYRLGLLLVSRIERAFAITFPDVERYFVAIHLAGKRAFHKHSRDVVTPDIIRLFDLIHRKIFDSFALDLSGDFELFHLLSLHLIPMMDRLRWDLKIHNPLLEEIKQENIKAFEMAVLAGDIIHQETGLKVNDAEIGYLAIHFALSIERCGCCERRYNVLLVCTSGMGSSQLLLHRLRQRFASAINHLKVCQLYELPNADLTAYDIILTTVDMPFNTPVPVLKVNYFFDAGDFSRMEQWLKSARSQAEDDVRRWFQPSLFYTDLKATDRYALLTALCQRIIPRGDVDENFLHWVIAREELSATAFGQGIAFPHPLHPCGDKTFVAVALLEKPISWDNYEVRYIFLLNIRKGEQASLQNLYESLISFMDNDSKRAALDKNPTFDTLMSLLAQR
ncbi:BglG family transcription antiterminator [Pantoea septica]|uniref:BglG family transcription antiterminator n=1 Tax=Pantoea septica TaxID=472695 RepID=UPI003D04BB69